MSALYRIAGVLGLALLLAACGFHFRKAPDLPPSMRHIYIAAPGQSGDLLRELRRGLASNDTEVLETPEGASTTLSLISVTHTSRPLALNREGRPLLYQVEYEVEFSLLVQGAVILEPQTVVLTRNYTYSVSNAVANEEQEQALDLALSKDIAQFMVMRVIAAAKSLPPSLATLPVTANAPAAASTPPPVISAMPAPAAATTPPPV